MQGPFLRTKSTSIRLAIAFSFLIFLTVFIIAALPPTTTATFQGTQSDVSQKRLRPEFVPGEALVRYRSESTAIRQTQQKQHSMLSAAGRQVSVSIERSKGLEIVSGLRLARMAPEDTMAAIEALKKEPDVLYAEPNYLLYLDLTPNDPRFTAGDLFGLIKIGAPSAWDTTTGSSSVVVGVTDEGIDRVHPDLQANIWINPAEIAGNGVDDDSNGFIDDVNGYNFAANTGTIPAENHATHVAGTIGAVGNNNTGVVGVNWQVRLMSLRFISGSSGSTANAIRATNYARQMHDLWISSSGTKGANVRVLNNSYGGGAFSQSFLDAINGLNQSGILFVAAAGNNDNAPELDNDIVPHYPGSYDAPNVIAVAATDSSDGLASFSHFGATSVQLGAPGVGILSTTANNTYSIFNGTSMATPHVAGAAALLLAQNPKLTVQQLKSLLIFNGDPVSSLAGKTLTGRRLNVANSFVALAQNDTTPPGTVTNFHINSQVGRALNVGWTSSGDDGAAGQASLYRLTFTDATTGTVIFLKSVIPTASGVSQAVDVKIPYRHTSGTLTLREFDNSGNEGVPATFNVSVSLLEGDPYLTSLGSATVLSTGGTPLSLIGDDKLKLNFALPFSFPFFGQNFSTVNISTNGNLFFSPPPMRSNGDADDVPSSSIGITKFKMISGLWDDLRTDSSATPNVACTGCDVFVVNPDPSRIIFRWVGVTFGDGSPATEFPVNFEIELRSNGTILSRYGSGQSAPVNTNLFPVVGIAGGEPDAYVIPSHTSEQVSTNLTNAPEVTYL
ncbi:MAG TPA: S8 family peptidase, partial [Pyrinomonadaceae bacterium]